MMPYYVARSLQPKAPDQAVFTLVVGPYCDDGPRSALDALTSLVAADSPPRHVAVVGLTGQVDGAAVYERQCAACHGGAVKKAPEKTMLQLMSARVILAAMEEGIMQPQASTLSRGEREAVAEGENSPHLWCPAEQLRE